MGVSVLLDQPLPVDECPEGAHCVNRATLGLLHRPGGMHSMDRTRQPPQIVNDRVSLEITSSYWGSVGSPMRASLSATSSVAITNNPSRSERSQRSLRRCTIFPVLPATSGWPRQECTRCSACSPPEIPARLDMSWCLRRVNTSSIWCKWTADLFCTHVPHPFAAAAEPARVGR